MSRSRIEEVISTFVSPLPQSKSAKETEEDALAGQINQLVKEINLSNPTPSSNASLSSEKITAPTNVALTTADVASKFINMGEIEKTASAVAEAPKDEFDEQVDQFEKKVSAFDKSMEEEPLTAETAIRKINVAWEILQLGLQLEQRIFQDLDEINNELTKLQEKPKAILALQQKFINKKELIITEEIRADLTKLKDLGVDLGLDKVEKISAEKLESIKTVLDGHKSQAQSETQKLMMNYQDKIQQLGSITDSLKIVTRRQGDLIATITQHMSR